MSMRLRKLPILAGYLILSGIPLCAQNFLHTQGRNIVDSSGTPVILRGIGLGGWLVPEGYMLHMPGYGSPSDIEDKIESVAGAEAAAEFWQRYRELYVTRADIGQMAEWGFNSVRLPLHYKLLYDKNTAQYLESGFALIDSLVAWCRDHRMYVILDMHCAPGGQNAGNISDSDGTARLWTEQANQDLTVEIWRTLAAVYKNEPVIGGYDLLNEPVLPNGYSNGVLRAFYIRLVNEIRPIDANHLIFIEGNWYATDFNLLTPPFDSNMAYSFHKYWSSTSVNTISSYLNMRQQHNVPLWMGESGENSNPWFYETVRVYEDNDIGWAWWTHKKFDNITNPFSVPMTDGYRQLLDYWSGNVSTPPPQQTAIDWLMEQVEKIHSDSCDYRPGVVPSLLDPQFGTLTKPVRNHVIPGIINAVDYDIGTNGISYFDSSYKNESGSAGGMSSNQGGQYRNDGVDIEISNDPLGYGYNVGWIDAGEYLSYTVSVPYAGIYRAQLRVASNSSSGSLLVALDGNLISDAIVVPGTGGWQNWQTIYSDSLTIPAGEHVLSLYFQEGNFNFNRIEFVTITVTDSGEYVPRTPFLNQNFPNPFNQSTTISFYLPDPGNASVEIFEITGRQLATVWDHHTAAGWTEISFNGNSYASGVYCYRLTAGKNSQLKKMMLLK
jgi:endoglucanase